MKTPPSFPFAGTTHRRNRRVIRTVALAIFLCVAAVQSSAQLIFTDWTTIANEHSYGKAIGHIGPVQVALQGLAHSAWPRQDSSVLDGSSHLFDDPVFTPSLPQSDYLELITDMNPLFLLPSTNYVITFSSPVRDPVIHLSSVMQWVGFPGLTVSRLSGDDGFTVERDTVFGTYGLGGPDSQGDGTVQLLGTFTNINFFAEFRLTDSDLFSLQLGATPLPLLSVVSSEQGVTLRWPLFATNYVLEAATNLSPPAVWATVTNSAEQVGESFSVRVEPDLARRFFRLRNSE